ncbi:hypothetical protein [Paraburkholderia monticola]|uniref:hypothetical protein n=1 Tax=Paraburkholderia monticola TaxID=1399968 RepID=UPI000784E639|nr:hypothetical protein [Paraburkholderia monticola]
MKTILICILIALVLTLPVGVGIAHVPGVAEWFASGEGYEFFDPFFNAFGADGGESTSDIIFGTLYVVSFVVSLALAIAAWAIVSGLRRMDRR